MKNRLLVVFILFCSISMVFAAQQPEISGKDLLAKFNSTAKSDHDYVLGYTKAVYAFYMNTSTLATDQEIEKVIKVGKDYLEKNTKRLDQPANKLLKEAFEKSFPKK